MENLLIAELVNEHWDPNEEAAYEQQWLPPEVVADAMAVDPGSVAERGRRPAAMAAGCPDGRGGPCRRTCRSGVAGRRHKPDSADGQSWTLAEYLPVRVQFPGRPGKLSPPTRSGALAVAVGADVLAVAAAGLAEPLGAVARQVDHDVVAVVGGAVLEPVERVGADHVGERHRGLDQHPGGERCLLGYGVDVPAEVVVVDELGECLGVREDLVDRGHEVSSSSPPHGPELRSDRERTASSSARSPVRLPVPPDLVEQGDQGLLGRLQGVLARTGRRGRC